jgi:hypothetical protein
MNLQKHKPSKKKSELFNLAIDEIEKRGFNCNDRDKINDERLGIEISFKNEDGHYIEIYDIKGYYQVFLYGFDSTSYYPKGFDILFKEDIPKFGLFIDDLFNNIK